MSFQKANVGLSRVVFASTGSGGLWALSTVFQMTNSVRFGRGHEASVQMDLKYGLRNGNRPVLIKLAITPATNGVAINEDHELHTVIKDFYWEDLGAMLTEGSTGPISRPRC